MRWITGILLLLSLACVFGGCSSGGETYSRPIVANLSGITVAFEPAQGAYATESTEAIGYLMGILRTRGARVIDPSSVKQVLVSNGYVSFDAVSLDKAREIASNLGVDYIVALNFTAFTQTGKDGVIETNLAWTDYHESRVTGSAIVKVVDVPTMSVVFSQVYTIDLMRDGQTGIRLKPGASKEATAIAALGIMTKTTTAIEVDHEARNAAVQGVPNALRDLVLTKRVSN